jgi:hypothetical protein
VAKVLDAQGRSTGKYVPSFTDKASPLKVEVTEETSKLVVDLEKNTLTASSQTAEATHKAPSVLVIQHVT